MKNFKYFVVVVISILLEVSASKLSVRRHTRDVNPSMLPFPGYPTMYSYPNVPPMQMPLPYQIPYYGMQQLPINVQPPFPQYQNYPYMNMYPSYNPYGQTYQPYNPYSPYPYYPSYSQQITPQSYPDPYAHIPTEIIDIDTNMNVDPEFLVNDELVRPELTPTNQTYNYNQAVQRIGPYHTSNVVTTKPVQATISRTYSSSSDPVVKVDYSNTGEQKGTGVLINASEDKIESEENFVEEDNDEEEEEGDRGDNGGFWG